MDLESLDKWDDYTSAKEETAERITRSSLAQIPYSSLVEFRRWATDPPTP